MGAPPVAAHVQKSWVYVVAASLAAIAHLLAGYFYVISGLGVPVAALTLLVAWWLLLTCIGLRFAKRRSYWVLCVPVVAVGTLVMAVWLGGEVLGWSA